MDMGEFKSDVAPWFMDDSKLLAKTPDGVIYTVVSHQHEVSGGSCILVLQERPKPKKH